MATGRGHGMPRDATGIVGTSCTVQLNNPQPLSALNCGAAARSSVRDGSGKQWGVYARLLGGPPPAILGDAPPPAIFFCFLYSGFSVFWCKGYLPLCSGARCIFLCVLVPGEEE